MFEVLKDLARKLAGAGKGQPRDRRRPVSELFGRFFFEDGTVAEAGVFSDRGMHLTPEAPTYSMRAHGGLPAYAGGV